MDWKKKEKRLLIPTGEEKEILLKVREGGHQPTGTTGGPTKLGLFRSCWRFVVGRGKEYSLSQFTQIQGETANAERCMFRGARTVICKLLGTGRHPSFNQSYHDKRDKSWRSEEMLKSAGPLRDCEDAGWYQDSMKVISCQDARSISLYKRIIALLGEV